MASLEQKIPYGVGRLTFGWYRLVLILLALIAVGAYAYQRQFTEGEIVTGMRDIGTMGGAAWGLYISFVVYFVGVSFAGITIAAIVRLLNLEHLRPISRMAEVLTVITLLLGAGSVLADLGQPLRAMVNLFLYGRPMSPFFGTFSLVMSGYLFASLVYLYLSGRRDAYLCAQRGGPLQGFYRLWAAGYRDTPAQRERHHRTSFWLALAILPLLVAAHSTLGFVFGLQVGRPGWFSALQAPSFVVMAGVSGTGVLIVIAAILRRSLATREQLNLSVFRWLSNFLMGLTGAYIYLMIVDWLTGAYAAHHHEARLTAAIVSGDYSGIFWASVVFLAVPFAILFLQFVTKRYSIGLIVAAGVIVNLAAVGKRYLIVVPSQTHGSLLPYEFGIYSPTWVEYSVILGLVATGTLLYAIFMKVFPIIETQEPSVGGR